MAGKASCIMRGYVSVAVLLFEKVRMLESDLITNMCCFNYKHQHMSVIGVCVD